MDARFTAEQDEIRRTLRELLRKRCGPKELRAATETPAGHDPALWRALAGQLGLPGLAVPEAYGGVGCSATELALACEETGRVLAPSPLLATAVLTVPLVRALGTEAQRADLLPRLASGALTATLAVPPGTALGLTGDNRGDWAGGGRAGGVQARRAGAGWRLYGQVDQVLDGHSAGLLLVAAHAGGFARSRTLLFLVPGDAPGLVRTRQTALDATRPQARVQLRDVEAELLGDSDSGSDSDGGSGSGDSDGNPNGSNGNRNATAPAPAADVPAALAHVGDTAAAVLACEAVGAADRALELTVGYVGQREQFGRPVGSFQAVKHRLADVYVQLQAARSAAYFAAWAVGQGEQRVGGLALAQALEALRTAAAEGIQLHGGIGFTWEHEAHLYFKRAAGDELLFGPAHRLRAHAADAAGLFERATEVAV
ncbi:acyl-CoA dehydrogenase family protein [Streptomyces sp. SID13726]|uniref:acyl-CoA dehydrogenase family protein n=1 Tax=Streptomyces sp. SID13726 TaxID=2706058 RepID=UPI0013BCFA9F|nr:acyl-CoA dehydrogenase family protein [Streptomyces sp. SID13726]NEB04906.1 acyl-CoA dehydrogenase [Streptomyces sp. SID13726]